MGHRDYKTLGYKQYIFRFYFHNQKIEILNTKYEQLKIIDIENKDLDNLERIVEERGAEMFDFFKQTIKKYNLDNFKKS